MAYVVKVYDPLGIVPTSYRSPTRTASTASLLKKERTMADCIYCNQPIPGPMPIPPADLHNNARKFFCTLLCAVEFGILCAEGVERKQTRNLCKTEEES
jgi:hypothetical protein